MLRIKESRAGLLLRVPKLKDRQELKEEYEDINKSEASIWSDLFEPYYTNGRYYPIDPEVYYVGLTTDPYIIAEDVTYDVDGQINGIVGRMWHCPNYMVESVIEKLVIDGEYYLMEVTE